MLIMRNECKNETNAILPKFAWITVLALFPIFFFYNAALALGFSQRFLGGGFVYPAITLGLPLIFLQILSVLRRQTKIVIVDIMFLVMIIYMLIWASVNYFFGDGYQRDYPLYQETLQNVFVWSVVYTAFRNLSFNSKFMKIILPALLAGMLVISFLNISGEMFNAAQLASGEVRVATYQGFARSAFVTALLLLSASRGWRLSAYVIITLVLLFILGARSEFAGFFVAGGLIVLARERAKRSVLVWMPLFLALFVYILLATDVLEGGSRIINLLDLKADASAQMRLVFQAHALKTISSHWLLGGYGSELELGELGDYAHNALSAWVSYGLIGFLMFTGMNMAAMFSSARATFMESLSYSRPSTAFFLGVSGFCVLSMVASKVVYDPIFAVAWGSYASSKLVGLKKDQA